MAKKAITVRIEEDILEAFNTLLEKYNVSQGTVVEMGLKYILGLNEQEFEKEYLKHIRKKL